MYVHACLCACASVYVCLCFYVDDVCIYSMCMCVHVCMCVFVCVCLLPEWPKVIMYILTVCMCVLVFVHVCQFKNHHSLEKIWCENISSVLLNDEI